MAKKSQNMEESQKDLEMIKLENEKMQKQYDRLINARNYHYENLNKWLMTFYVIIGALFVAFYSVKTVEYQIIVAIVGYIVSLSAWLSGKGYGYWENIWIEKINHFEKNVLKSEKDMQVYTYIKKDDKHDHPCHPFKGANVSTTKVAIFMTASITIAWGSIIMILWDCIKYITEDVAISIGVSYALMILGEKLFPSIEKTDSTNEQAKK